MFAGTSPHDIPVNLHPMKEVRDADVLLMLLSRRLLGGLSGSNTQRRPLRSQEDVRQQRPGPQRLQAGDHHHGESIIATWARRGTSSHTETCFFCTLDLGVETWKFQCIH